MAATAAGACAVVLAAGCSGGRSHSGSPSPGAGTDPPAGPLVIPANRPTAYHVTYRADDLTGSTTQVRWDDLQVLRPFLARSVTLSGRPGPDAVVLNGTLTSPDGLFRVDATGITEVSGRQPAIGTDDQALGRVLADAVRRNLAKPLSSTRTVAGRQCHDVRFAEPVAGPLKRLGDVDGHDDLCLDADGLVLREEWTLRGKIVLRREAETVEVDPSGLEAALSAAGARPRDATVAAPIAAPLDATVDQWFPLPAPPPGFTTGPAVGFAFPDPQQAGQLAYTSSVWAFTRGGDLVTVEAGSGGAPWRPDDPSEKSTIGAGDHPLDATSVVRSDGIELRALVPGEHVRWVRVRGTMSVAELEAYAKTLVTPAG